MEWQSDKSDYIENIKDAERRFFHHPVEYREDQDGKVEGIASRVNEWYDLGYFEERVAKGAFKDVLNDDVRALFNHDPNLVLARTKSKTLELYTDNDGNLVYRYKTPERSYAKDLEDAIKSGDVDQSSFAFRVAEEKWEWRDDNKELQKDRRTITKFEKLYDVSPVTYPASPSTKVAARSIENHEEDLKTALQKRNEDKLKLLKAKLTLIEKK